MAILVPIVIPGGRKRGKNGGYNTHSLIYPEDEAKRPETGAPTGNVKK
jgi:hypothetical protein